MQQIGICVPAIWVDTLRHIEFLTHVTPILSGGALRDTYHGVPVKDLDIFLPHDRLTVQLIENWLGMIGYTRFQTVDGSSCEELNEVDYVSGWRHPSAPEMNFVFLNRFTPCTIQGVCERNDFGICQIAGSVDADGQFKVWATEAFVHDAAEGKFTLLRTGDENRSLTRWERLKAKYPGFRLVTPFLDHDDRMFEAHL